MRRGIPPRRPFRPGRGAMRGRFIAQNNSRNLRATINISDSDYDYDSSGDIQVINVQQNSNKNKQLLFSDSEEEYSSDHDSIQLARIHKQDKQREIDWNASKTPPEIAKKRIEKEDNLRIQSKPFDFQDSPDQSSYSIEEQINLSTKQKKNDTKPSNVNIETPNKNSTNHVKRAIQQNNENQDTLKTDESFNPNHNVSSHISNNITSINTPANGNNLNGNISSNDINSNNENDLQLVKDQNPQVLPEVPSVDPIQNIDSHPFQSFTVVRKGKKFSKISFELFENSASILKSSSKKEGKKIIQLVYKENNLDDNISSLPIYVGYIRDRKKKHFYTFYTTTKKDDRDDREGELLCIYFNDNSNQENSNSASGSLDSTKSSVSVIIPKTEKPNYPISQRLTFENFLVTGKFDQSKFIKLVGSKITSEIESEFGSSFYIKSGKNCALVEPNSNKYVFILLKSNYEIFNMKVRPPLTVQQGFALAISLIKHNI